MDHKSIFICCQPASWSLTLFQSLKLNFRQQSYYAMDHLDEGTYKKKGKNQHVLRWRDKMRETQRSISTQRLGLVGKRSFDTLARGSASEHT